MSQQRRLHRDERNYSQRSPVQLRTPRLIYREDRRAPQVRYLCPSVGFQEHTGLAGSCPHAFICWFCRQPRRHVLLKSPTNLSAHARTSALPERRDTCGQTPTTERFPIKLKHKRYCLSNRWQMHRAIVWVLKALALYSLQTEWQPRVIITQD